MEQRVNHHLDHNVDRDLEFCTDCGMSVWDDPAAIDQPDPPTGTAEAMTSATEQMMGRVELMGRVEPPLVYYHERVSGEEEDPVDRGTTRFIETGRDHEWIRVRMVAERPFDIPPLDLMRCNACGTAVMGMSVAGMDVPPCEPERSTSVWMWPELGELESLRARKDFSERLVRTLRLCLLADLGVSFDRRIKEIVEGSNDQ